MKSSIFTILLIKCEKNAVEIKSSVSEQFIFQFYFLVFNCTNFTMDILMKIDSNRLKLGSTAF